MGSSTSFGKIVASERIPCTSVPPPASPVALITLHRTNTTPPQAHQPTRTAAHHSAALRTASYDPACACAAPCDCALAVAQPPHGGARAAHSEHALVADPFRGEAVGADGSDGIDWSRVVSYALSCRGAAQRSSHSPRVHTAQPSSNGTPASATPSFLDTLGMLWGSELYA